MVATRSLVLAGACSAVLVACGSSDSGTNLKDQTGGSGGATSGSGAGTTTGTTGSGIGPGKCPIFPADNPWNTDISDTTAYPADAMSDTWIASIGKSTSLHPDFGSIYGIPYQYVDNTTAKVPVSFTYASESDKGPYPIPVNPLVEKDSDHHLLMVHNDECKLYEMWASKQSASGAWHAGSGAIFDLTSDALRPDGWTSADAAGLPVFAGLARYDEAVTQGEIKHALRFTASTTQSGYVTPARHSAGSGNDATLPPMGIRVRLKGSVDISGFKPELQAVLKALQTYGAFLADNGSDWYISGAPDKRWSDDNLHDINQLTGNDFEVIKLAGPITPGD
jgi:hypothetical protein